MAMSQNRGGSYTLDLHTCARARQEVDQMGSQMPFPARRTLTSAALLAGRPGKRSYDVVQVILVLRNMIPVEPLCTIFYFLRTSK